MNILTDWIPITDRPPTREDLPFMLGAFASHGAWTQLYYSAIPYISYGDQWTHWFPMSKVPAPPKKVLPQRKEDEKAFYDWSDHGHIGPIDPRVIVWHAALAWERVEIFKQLNENAHRDDIFNGIRARCTP